MKKKIFFVLTILLLTTVGLFAQERAQNNVSATFGIVGAGLSYERMFNNYLSVLGDVSYTTLIFMDEFTVSAKGRVYPFGGDFFLDLGLGYSYGRGVVGGVVDMIIAIFTFGLVKGEDLDDAFARKSGFLIQPGLGWKIDIGKPDGFVMPLIMGLDIKAGKVPDFMPYFRIGLGYSF